MNNKMLMLLGLATTSLLLTGLILGGTSYASLGDALGGDFQKDAEGFSSAELAAAQSGSVTSPATPAPPPSRYASERMKVFALSSGMLEVFGFAPNSSDGILGGKFFPQTALLSTDPNAQPTRFDGENGWYIEVYFLHTNIFGQSTFQVNLFNPAGVLQDDGYRFTGG